MADRKESIATDRKSKGKLILKEALRLLDDDVAPVAGGVRKIPPTGYQNKCQK